MSTSVFGSPSAQLLPLPGSPTAPRLNEKRTDEDDGGQHADFHAGFASLLSNSAFADLTLLVGPEKRSLKCHKCIVSAHSGFFRKALTAPFKESQSSEIKFPETSYPIMEKVLSFLYTGDYKADDAETGRDSVLAGIHAAKELTVHAEVYATADMLDVDLLKQKSLDYITRTLESPNGKCDPDALTATMELVIPATRGVEKHRLDGVVKFISKNLSGLMKQEKFVRMLEANGELAVALLRKQTKKKFGDKSWCENCRRHTDYQVSVKSTCKTCLRVTHS